MKVTIIFQNLEGERQELYYFSNYDRINAKGIKEEAKRVLVNKLGNHARNYEIINLYREED